MTNILILGAGFGGIRTALDLEKRLKGNSSITLVDRRNFHLFTPSLYEVATIFGLKQDSFAQYLRGSVAIPIAEIFKNKRINFIQAEIAEINLDKKYVKTGGRAELNFDYLVFALGGVTEFFRIPGVQEYAFDFKDIDDAVAIYKKISDFNETGLKADRDKKAGLALRVAVIGGGFTGVELAAELSCCMGNIVDACKLDKECAQVNLFEAAPVILPALNEKQRKTIENRLKKLGVQVKVNSPVVEVGPGSIKVKDGGELREFDLIIWVGGIRGPKIFENLGLKLNKRGFIKVNEFLQAINADGTINERIFIIGDSAGYIDPKTEKPVPATAYVAHSQGALVARNIHRLIKSPAGWAGNKKLKKPKSPLDIWIAPVGGKWAYFHLNGINIKGFFGYILRQLADLRYFLSILPFSRALTLFFKDLVIFTKND